MALALRRPCVALLALALLVPSSQGEALQDKVAQEVYTSLEGVPLPKAPAWTQSEEGQKLLGAFTKTSFPFVELVGWLTNMDEEDFSAFKELSKTVMERTHDVMKIVRTAKDFVDPKKVQRLGPVAAGLNHLIFKDPDTPRLAKVERTAMSREEAKAARQQERLDAAERRKTEKIQAKEEVAKARIEAQQQKVEERLQKAEERKQRQQTPEEQRREVQTRESLHHTIRLLVSKMVSHLHMNATAGLLSLPIESEVVPAVMKLRRNGGADKRTLVDTVANISMDDVVGSDNIVKALFAKSQDLVRALNNAGDARPAEILNFSVPIFELLLEMPPLLTEERQVDTASAAQLIRSLVELPELQRLQALEETRREASVLAKLLEAGSRKRVPAKSLLHSLGLQYSGELAPLLADLIFAANDVNAGNASFLISDLETFIGYMPNVPKKDTIVNFVALGKHLVAAAGRSADGTVSARDLIIFSTDLMNLFDMQEVMSGSVRLMRWVLLVVCNAHGTAGRRSFCKDYTGTNTANLFKKPQSSHPAKLHHGASFLAKKTVLRGARPQDALRDETILVQRAVEVRPAFPTKKLVHWAETSFSEELGHLQSGIDVIKKVAWVFNDDHVRLVKTFMSGFKVFKLSQEAMKKAQEAQAAPKEQRTEMNGTETREQLREEKKKQKEAAKEARKAARGTPAPKQTPEEREREKVSRAKITGDFDHLMEEFLSLPAVARKAVEALIVPEIMQFRKKGGHRTRTLVDEIAGMSLNVTSKEELPKKALELVEAIREAGYETLPKTVDWAKTHAQSVMSLATQVRSEAQELKKEALDAGAKGTISTHGASRLLSAATRLPLGNATHKGLQKLVAIVDAHKAADGTLAGVIRSTKETDSAGAKLLEDLEKMVQLAAHFATSPAERLEPSTLRSLVKSMADASGHLAEWPALELSHKHANLYRGSAMVLGMLAEFQEGHEVELAKHFAATLPMTPEVSTNVLKAVDMLMTFVCFLRSTGDNLAGCREFRDAAEAGKPIDLVAQ